MAGTAAQIATLLEHIGHDAMAQLEDITQEDLNLPLTLPESNTLFVLATHLVSAGEFWVLVLVGQRDIPRDRQAEFQASGHAQDLLIRYKNWLQNVHEVLDTLPDEDLDQPANPPAGYLSTSRRATSNKRDALLHAVEHSALHLGHIQLTRQLLGYAPPAS